MAQQTASKIGFPYFICIKQAEELHFADSISRLGAPVYMCIFPFAVLCRDGIHNLEIYQGHLSGKILVLDYYIYIYIYIYTIVQKKWLFKKHLSSSWLYYNTITLHFNSESLPITGLKSQKRNAETESINYTCINHTFLSAWNVYCPLLFWHYFCM